MNKQAKFNLDNTINKDILEANNWKYIPIKELPIDNEAAAASKVVETIDDCIIKKCANSK